MIELTDEMRTRIGSALDDGLPVVTSSVGPDGQPTISFYGSTQVFSADQLAIWVRARPGGLTDRIKQNPKMAFLYRNPAERIGWQFHGRAKLVEDATIAQQVYDNSPERERNSDPDREGHAILIDVDKVVARGEVLMER
ncbi:MAG: pyridoxamine 5'-phosphate oxidase family protein [Chloroflexi bacterium]|nr:pyridoxamine 5'-phosphate oxidase family protein [Chloroflexota bacterium]MDA1146673.1 pyridoxamine 5'-phosphate oxidase family protein [Chloroflexota bacterium]